MMDTQSSAKDAHDDIQKFRDTRSKLQEQRDLQKIAIATTVNNISIGQKSHGNHQVTKSGDCIKSLDELYDAAFDAAPKFNSLILICLTNFQPREMRWIPAHIKSRRRCAEKVSAMGRRQYSSVYDVVRGSIIVEDEYGINRLVAALPSKDIVRLKNRFREPTPGCYQDIIVNIRVDIDSKYYHICELQIHLQRIFDVAKYLNSHDLYKKFIFLFRTDIDLSVEEKINLLELTANIVTAESSGGDTVGPSVLIQSLVMNTIACGNLPKMQCLGTILEFLQERSTKLTLSIHVFRLLEESHGFDTDETIKAAITLATDYILCSQFREGMELQSRILNSALCHRLPGSLLSAFSLRTITHFARVHNTAGSYRESVRLYDMAVSADSAISPEVRDSFEVSMVLFELAGVHFKIDNRREAQATYERILANSVFTEGDESVNVATARKNLLILLCEGGNVLAACSLYSEYMKGDLASITGSLHSDLDRLCSALNKAVEEQVRERGDLRPREVEWKGLHTLLQEIVEVLQSRKGHTHRTTLLAMTCLADICAKLGDSVEAIRQYEAVLSSNGTLLQSSSPAFTALDASTVGEIKAKLADATVAGSSPQEAQDQLELLVAEQEQQLGPRHTSTLASKCALARVLERCDKLSEALGLLERVVADTESSFGVDHSDTLAALLQLGGVLVKLRKYSAAKICYERFLASHSEGVGGDITEVGGDVKYDMIDSGSKKDSEPPSRCVAEAELKLAEVMEALGDFNQAQKYYFSAIDRLGQSSEPHEDLVCRLRINLARSLSAAGDQQHARDILEDVIGRSGSGAGCSDVVTWKARHEYASVLMRLGLASDAKGQWEEVLQKHDAHISSSAMGSTESSSRESESESELSLVVLQRLAECEKTLGNYEQAQTYYKRLLHFREAAAGDNSTTTRPAASAEAIVLLSSLLVEIAQLERMRTNLNQSKQQYERALAGFEKVYGCDHIDSAAAAMALAEVLHLLKESTRAIGLCEKAVSVYGSALGTSHPTALVSAMQLARLYRDVGRVAESRALCERVYRDCEGALGPYHSLTLEAANNLANSLRKAHDFSSAKEMFQRAMKHAELHLDAHNKTTLRIVNDFAGLLSETNDFAWSEALYRRALRGYEQTVGLAHEDTLAVVYNLANLLSQHDHVDEAVGLYRRALKENEQLSGLKHEHTLAVMVNYALILIEAREYSMSQIYFERALEGHEENFGADHVLTLGAVTGLATLRKRMHDNTVARVLFERALHGYEAALGPDHPTTLAAVTNLADFLMEICDFQEAKTLYCRKLAVQEKTLGKYHVDTLNTTSSAMIASYSVGNYVDAFRFMKRNYKAVRLRDRGRCCGVSSVLQGSVLPAACCCLPLQAAYMRCGCAVYGSQPLMSIIGATTIALLCPALPLIAAGYCCESATACCCVPSPVSDRIDDIKTQRLLLESREKEFGLDHSATIESVKSLAAILAEVHDWDAAVQMYQRALSSSEVVYGSDHHSTLSVVLCYARLLVQMEAHNDAYSMFERALVGYESTLDPKHPFLVRIVDEVAAAAYRAGHYRSAASYWVRKYLSTRLRKKRYFNPEVVMEGAALPVGALCLPVHALYSCSGCAGDFAAVLSGTAMCLLLPLSPVLMCGFCVEVACCSGLRDQRVYLASP